MDNSKPFNISIGCPSRGHNELHYISQVVQSGRWTQGEWVARLEREFADKFNYPYAVACNNGTSALHLALLALGIGEGDKVIVPATTFVATANAVKYTGATPVICDVDSKDWNISTQQVQKLVETIPNIKAVIAVHLYGNTCDMATLGAICERYNLFLIEDCAEALGAKYDDEFVGLMGDIGTFSFYGNKTITTGEGGMVVTRQTELAEKVRFYRGQAQDPTKKFFHLETGYNYRLVELSAALGVAQLEIFDGVFQKRQTLYEVYRHFLPKTVRTPLNRVGWGYWMLAIQLPQGINPAQVAELMAHDGIETRPVFYPLNHMPMYRDNAPLGTVVANMLFNRGLVLPLHAELKFKDVATICQSLTDAMEKVSEQYEPSY